MWRFLMVIQIGLAIPQVLLGGALALQQGASTQHFNPISVYIDCPQEAKHQLTESFLGLSEDMFGVRTAQETAEYIVRCGALRESFGMITSWKGELDWRGNVVEIFGEASSHEVAQHLGLAMLRHRLLGKDGRNQAETHRQPFNPVKVSVRVTLSSGEDPPFKLPGAMPLEEHMKRALSATHETRGLFEVQDREEDADYAIIVTRIVLTESGIVRLEMVGELHHRGKVVAVLQGVDHEKTELFEGHRDLIYDSMLIGAARDLVKGAKMAMLRHRLLGQ